jgi:hypothetical protein
VARGYVPLAWLTKNNHFGTARGSKRRPSRHQITSLLEQVANVYAGVCRAMLDWNRALGVIVHGHVFADQKKKPVHGRLVRADCFCTIATSSTALCFDAVVLQAALVVGSFPPR